MTHRSNGPSKFANETGAVMPIVALTIVMLLVFAALTVDLGAAWAQRRESQTAADAGAMAGALAVGDIVTGAIDYVERNVGDPTSLDWSSCPEPDPHFSSFTDDAGDIVAFTLADSSVTNCVWIGSTNTAATETFIAVRVPNVAVDTAFAPIIGIDTIDVDASAIARLGVEAQAKILPFFLPPGAGTHTCLGSPPAGLSHAPCSGGTSGNYGYIASPQNGDASLGTTLECADNSSAKVDVLAANMAIGIDHPITIDPTWPANNSLADADFLDQCVGGAPRTDGIPNSLNIVQGVNYDIGLQRGMVSSSETFGANSTRSRLQHSQPSGLTPVMDSIRTVRNSSGSYGQPLDNLGLWEYISSGTGLCDPQSALNKPLWVDAGGGGPDATDALLACLNNVNAGGSTVTFSPLLIDSPRFAVIPQTWNTIPSGNSQDRAIEQFRAVYLQSSWYACPQCITFLDIDGNDQDVFNPGEGIDDGVSSKKKESQMEIDGISALLIPVTASPSGVIDFGPDADQVAVAELVG